MDEILKRRLVGAAVLLLGAFLVASLLPRPGTLPALEPGQKRAIIDLRSPAPAAQVAANPERPPEPAEPVIAAPGEEAAVAEAASEELALTETLALPKTQQTASVPPPGQPVPPVPKPVLKMDVALSSGSPGKPQSVAPMTPAAATKPTAPLEKPWYVQAGAFGEVNNARQLLVSLEAEGFRGIIAPAETAEGTRYRARIGPYANRDAADAARTQLAQKGVIGSIVQE